jgi:hypothetical protein
LCSLGTCCPCRKHFFSRQFWLNDELQAPPPALWAHFINFNLKYWTARDLPRLCEAETCGKHFKRRRGGGVATHFTVQRPSHHHYPLYERGRRWWPWQPKHGHASITLISTPVTDKKKRAIVFAQEPVFNTIGFFSTSKNTESSRRLYRFCALARLWPMWRVINPEPLVPWTTRPVNTSPREQLAPWTARPVDNSLDEQLTLCGLILNFSQGKFAPWETCPMKFFLPYLT